MDNMERRFVKTWIILFLVMYCFYLPLFPHTQTDPEKKSTSSQNTGQEPKTPPTVLENIQKAQPDIRWSVTFGKIFWSIIIFLGFLIMLRYLIKFLQILAERWEKLRLVLKRYIPLIRILGWTLALLIIIEGVLKPPIATLITIAASFGIAVGLAAQETLKNIFGGLMILFNRPFQIGDKIEIGKYYGEVIQIGLHSIRMVTPDDSLVTIPNGILLSQSVSDVNSGEPYCQVVAEFYLPPDIDLEKAKKIAYRAAAVSRYVYLNKPIVILFKNEMYQGRSLLKMRLKAYVLNIRYEFPFSSEMTENVIREFLTHKLMTPEQLSFMKV